MVNKQDCSGVRTAQDLERKYDFGGMHDSIESNRRAAEEVDIELGNFVRQTTKNLNDIQEQLDGKIETWFFAGIPTLENEPAMYWKQEDYANHVDDLYYDTDTGCPYRFMKDIDYRWEKIVDAELAEALALANAAKDTADGKRQVFVAAPTPPYNIGDLWFKDKEIYICNVKKDTGSFDVSDFIIATNYTEKIEATNKQVETIRLDVADIEKLFVKKAYIKDLMVQGGIVAKKGDFYELAALHIVGDYIEAGTIKADSLILRNSNDGLYYNLNTEGGTEFPQGLTEEQLAELSGGLLGSKIVRHSITVKELTAENIKGTGGWINLAEGKFEYWNADTRNGIFWDGLKLTVNAETITFGDNRDLADVDGDIKTIKNNVQVNPETGEIIINRTDRAGNILEPLMILSSDNITFHPNGQTKKFGVEGIRTNNITADNAILNGGVLFCAYNNQLFFWPGETDPSDIAMTPGAGGYRNPNAPMW